MDILKNTSVNTHINNKIVKNYMALRKIEKKIIIILTINIVNL